MKATAVKVPGGYMMKCNCGDSHFWGGTGAQEAARRQARAHAAQCNEVVDEALLAAGKKWAKAREAERTAAVVLYSAIVRAVENGMSESAAARQAGCDRMTVRRALGKL